MHSEVNPSRDEQLHLLQIWILPERRGIAPSYEQTQFPPETRKGQLRLVASHDGRDGSVTIHQDAELYVSLLGDGDSVAHAFRDGRAGWLHIATGEASVNGIALHAGDGAAIEGETSVTVSGNGEVLLFDLG